MAYDDGQIVALHAPHQGARVPRRIAEEIERTRIIDDHARPSDLQPAHSAGSRLCRPLRITKTASCDQRKSTFVTTQEASSARSSTAASSTTATRSPREVLDKIKAQGFKYSTKGAITISVVRYDHPAEKKSSCLPRRRRRSTSITDVISDAACSRDEERYSCVVAIWDADDQGRRRTRCRRILINTTRSI